MMCFKDMTFCVAYCATEQCNRNWRLRDKSDYYEWSQDFPGGEGPVAMTDFSNDCPDYEDAYTAN